MQNSMTDLKNYLFEQIERVNDDELDDEGLEKAIKRSKAITESAKTIVEIHKTQLDALKYATEELGLEVTPESAKQMLIGTDVVVDESGKGGGDGRCPVKYTHQSLRNTSANTSRLSPSNSWRQRSGKISA